MSITDTPAPLESVGVSVPLWQARFLLPLTVTPLEDGVNWRLDETFDFESRVLGRIITVPAGFTSDFASIPRPFWTLVGAPTGKYTRAAAVHDDLYRTPGLCTRKQADDVLMEAMIVCGVNWWTRQVVYAGVRLGGVSSYKGGL